MFETARARAKAWTQNWRGTYPIETKQRSWAKTILRRIISISLLGGTSFLVTGSAVESLWLTIAYHGPRVIVDFIEERFWAKVRWQRTTGFHVCPKCGHEAGPGA